MRSTRSVGKVVAFVTRQGPIGPEVLVFDHPSAGMQGAGRNAGGWRGPAGRRVREAWEETGLDQLSLVQRLGARAVRQFCHFVSDVETAEEWWVITPDGDGLCWRCRWAPLASERLDDNTRFGIRLDGRLVGRVDLNPLDPPNYVLGVWLDENATGQGHATEACRTVRAFAGSDLRATDVWAGVTHGNERSVALLRRLGFARVAELDHHSRFRLRFPGPLA